MDQYACDSAGIAAEVQNGHWPAAPDRDGRRVVGMAERPETKSIIVTQAVQDYAVAHSSSPPDEVQRSLI